MDTGFKILLLILVIISSYFLFINFNLLSIIPIWIICGLIDVSRHKTMNPKLIKEYFLGKGFLTFILSPLNLLCDLLSYRNLHTFKIEDLPVSHQNEINEIVKLFDENKQKISKRFEEKTSTSRHFGPLRMTYRILYNFNKVKKEGSFIEADGRINKWKYDPLFIFDDTLIHQSFNEEDNLRYCAFIDIIRPSYFDHLMKLILSGIGFLLKNTRSIFYKNWKMI